MNVLNETDNKLFNRKELVVEIDAMGGTPSRKDAVEEIAKKYGSKDLVVIRKINQNFGNKKAVVEARIYKDADSLKKSEPSFVLERGKPKQKEGEKNG
ncbi:MAG: hypothetical protein V1834_00940 [Candidatus Micrarchaeota archaeon]